MVRSVPSILVRIAILEPPKVPPSAHPVRVPPLEPPRRTKGYFLHRSLLDKRLLCSVPERRLVLEWSPVLKERRLILKVRRLVLEERRLVSSVLVRELRR
jgi:hypothetical protein